MHRCNASDADLVRDTWAGRCLALAAAASVHRKLAASQGAHWLHGAAPRWRVWAGALLGLLLLGSLPWLRLTLSPSVPRGLYRLHRVPATLTYGQLVLVDVPAALRPWWPRRTPLLTPVAGLPGDVLAVRAGHFYVNERAYGPVVTAAAGRALPQVASPTVVGETTVCLASPAPRSLDCRYTGPIPQATLQAMATPLWTWD